MKSPPHSEGQEADTQRCTRETSLCHLYSRSRSGGGWWGSHVSSCRGCCLVVKMLGIVSNVVPKLVQRNFRNSLMPCHQTRRQHGGRGSSGWRLGRGQEEDMEIIFSLMRITPSTAPPLVGSVPQCLRCMVCGGWRELADVVFYKLCK